MSVLEMEELRKMIDLSEDAISKGQVMTSEQLKARHPRITYNENGVPEGISVQEFSNNFLDKLLVKYGLKV